MPPFKVVCLISGGKDSLFSILHCLQNGHEVIALANLHPPVMSGQDAEEDLDSYMYQTIGHKIIPLYKKALGLPLYRQEIAGSAVNQSKSYRSPITESGEHHDETESLVPLLQNVKKHHPEINAVSTGAILSDYQRTRVESVAIRLGLTPLSYLWQWPKIPPHTQTTLLEDMYAAGQDSRIIKVASGGLDSNFLWSNVADPRAMARINRAVERFGSGDDGAVLGEGGEYETLAVAGPAPLWKARIEVREDQMRIVPGEAGSASVKISDAALVEYSEAQKFLRVRVPPLLESAFEALLERIVQARQEERAPVENATSSTTSLSDHICHQYFKGPAGKPVAEQVAAMLGGGTLSTILGLQTPPFKMSDIAYVSIVLRRMSDFAAVNAVYTKAFAYPNPPARVTLAEPSILSEGCDVMLSFTCVRAPAGTRQGLHVQSQSYWAPANIGPYSQAISVPASSGEENSQRVLYVAGQIPLIPASMDLISLKAADDDLIAFSRQAVLAAQHFVRIGRAMQVKDWACGIAFITALSDEDAKSKADSTRRVWEGLHQSVSDSNAGSQDADAADDEDFDVWNVAHGLQRNLAFTRESVQTNIHTTAERERTVPQLVVIKVEGLPRAASMEWAVYGTSDIEGPALKIPHFEHLLEMFQDHIIP